MKGHQLFEKLVGSYLETCHSWVNFCILIPYTEKVFTKPIFFLILASEYLDHIFNIRQGRHGETLDKVLQVQEESLS